MRIWLVPPKQMCREHLLGEHRELHALVGSIENGNLASLRGHAERGQIATSVIQRRHDLLVKEMLRRGYNHDSPLDYEDDLDLGNVAELADEEVLFERCNECANREPQTEAETQAPGRTIRGP